MAVRLTARKSGCRLPPPRADLDRGSTRSAHLSWCAISPPPSFSSPPTPCECRGFRRVHVNGHRRRPRRRSALFPVNVVILRLAHLCSPALAPYRVLSARTRWQVIIFTSTLFPFFSTAYLPDYFFRGSFRLYSLVFSPGAPFLGFSCFFFLTACPPWPVYSRRRVSFLCFLSAQPTGPFMLWLLDRRRGCGTCTAQPFHHISYCR